MGLVRRRLASTAGEEGLSLLEGLNADQRFVGDLVGPDPLVRGIPSLLGHVAQGDVLDVDEDLILALLVPDVPAGVARVGQDHPDRALRPGESVAVAVALRVVGGRGQDAVAGQALRDRVDTLAGDELGEDPHDHVRRVRVGFEPVESLAVERLGRVRVRTEFLETVAVRRAATEEASFDLGESGHRRADSDLDAVPLALTDPTEHRHDQLVGLVGRIDGAAYLRYPQGYAVVLEDGEGQPELVAVERALRLTDHHGVVPAIGIGQIGEQQTGLWPT